MPTSKTPDWKKAPLPNSGQYVNSVGISSDGQVVIAGTYFYDYSPNANHSVNQPAFTVGVFVWNANGTLQWQDKFSATEGVYWVGLSRDGAYAAAGGLLGHSNGFLYAYNAATGAKQLTYGTHSRVNMVALSGDGRYLVAGAGNVYLFKRTAANWSAPQIIPGVTGDSIVSVGISDDGQWISAGTYQGRVILARNNNGILGPPAIWQQPAGTIHWIAMAADGSGFVAGANAAKVLYFDTAAFGGTPQPAWTVTLAGCSRCGSVAISDNGQFISAVGNHQKAGKVFLYSNQANAAQLLWSKATTRNPNSTSLDATGQFVTVADGYPDGTKGHFYVYNQAGVRQCSHRTNNMSWPMQISSNATGIAAGSDDSNVYYFT